MPVFLAPFITASLMTLPFIPSWEKNDQYSETWTAIVDTSENGYLQVQMNITNMGPGSGRSFCRFLWVSAKGSTTHRVEQRTQQAWETSASQKGFKTGPCEMSYNATQVLFVGNIKEWLVSLVFHKAPTLTSTPGSPFKNTQDEGTYVSDIVLPWGDVSGTLAQKGQPAQNIQGQGYIDHSLSTIKAYDLARGWVRFRSFKPGCETLFLARFPADSAHEASGYQWHKTHTQPRALKIQTASWPLPEASEKPWVLSSPQQESWVFKPQQKLYTHEPLEDYGILRRIIAHYIGDSQTVTYRAFLEQSTPRTPLCTNVSGILEIGTVQH